MSKMSQKTQVIAATASAMVFSASCAQSQPPTATKATQITSSTRSSAQVAAPSDVVNRVRLFPRAGFASRLVARAFRDRTWMRPAALSIWQFVKKLPLKVRWTAYALKNTKPYKYVRLFTPSGSWGNVAEIEFYNGTTKLKGQPYGTFGSRDNSGNDFNKAFDGNTRTFFDAAAANAQYLGIEIKSGDTSSTQSSPVVLGKGLRRFHIGNSLTDTIGEYTQQIRYSGRLQRRLCGSTDDSWFAFVFKRAVGWRFRHQS
jgi:hypothetical protein